MARKPPRRSVTYAKALLGPARCGADMSNGSERGEYVPMRRVLRRIGRPHRCVNIMFTFFPFDRGWPRRAEDVTSWRPGMGQWDLPYDNYFPLTGMVEGNRFTPVYHQCQDIRRTGHDVHLTLTIDCKATPGMMRAIARALVPFGRVFFRINHECNGFWFQNNRRYSFKQVGAFFCRFHDIVKEEAPLVQTVLCLNGELTPEGMHLGEGELAPAVRRADVIGIDRYISLFHGWPNEWTGDPATFYSNTIEEWWDVVRMAAEMVHEIRRDECSFTLPEINADADADGARTQARRVSEAYGWIKQKTYPRISAATFYQFRDRGGLGLEREDPVRRTYAGTQPVMAAYRRAVSDPHFCPSVKLRPAGGRSLEERGARWYHSEKAEGIGLEGTRPRGSRKMRLEFDEAPALVWCNGAWSYVEEGEAALDRVVAPGARFSAAVFFPPGQGVNSPAPVGWTDHYVHKITAMPEVTYT